jgi:hypothetical protein
MRTLFNERLYLAKLYEKSDSKWENKKAAKIYQSIGEEGKYLNLMNASLESGSDYFEMVEYYSKKGKNDLALEYAWIGVKLSEGGSDKLFDYLFEHYEAVDDRENLEKLYDYSETDRYSAADLSKRMWDYYAKRGDYQAAKKYLLDFFKRNYEEKIDTVYWQIEAYVTPEDWKNY